MTATEQWRVSAEYDHSAFDRLKRALTSLGYSIVPKLYGVAGSQEVSTYEATNASGVVTVESETYIGLTVAGAAMALYELKLRYDELSGSKLP